MFFFWTYLFTLVTIDIVIANKIVGTHSVHSSHVHSTNYESSAVQWNVYVHVHYQLISIYAYASDRYYKES